MKLHRRVAQRRPCSCVHLHRNYFRVVSRRVPKLANVSASSSFADLRKHGAQCLQNRQGGDHALPADQGALYWSTARNPATAGGWSRVALQLKQTHAFVDEIVTDLGVDRPRVQLEHAVPTKSTLRKKKGRKKKGRRQLRQSLGRHTVRTVAKPASSFKTSRNNDTMTAFRVQHAILRPEGQRPMLSTLNFLASSVHEKGKSLRFQGLCSGSFFFFDSATIRTLPAS